MMLLGLELIVVTRGMGFSAYNEQYGGKKISIISRKIQPSTIKSDR